MATTDGDSENPLDDIPDDDLETAATVIQRLVDAGEIDPDSPTGRLTAKKRDVLKALGVGIGGGVGIGAGSTQLVDTAAAGSQQSGTAGSASNPIDVYAEDIWPPGGSGSGNSTFIEAARAEQQNSNEVNLTRLVDDGTYTDILDAIVNEPPNHTDPKRFVIEPGVYQVSTQYTLLESNVEYAAYGRGHMWNEDAGTRPVVIEWTGTTGGGETMLSIGDNATKVEGVEFSGIDFVPQTANDSVTAVHLGGGATAPTRDVTFRGCGWRVFGTNPITRNTASGNFDWKFVDCTWHNNVNAAVFGSQTEIRGGYLLAADGNVGLDLGMKSSIYGLSADVKSGSTGVRANDNNQLYPDNIEGDGSGGSVGVEINAARGAPARVGGVIAGTETGIAIPAGQGAGFIHANILNTTTPVDLQGSNNDHNNTVIIAANYNPTNIAVANDDQRMLVLTSFEYANVDPLTLPPGTFSIDSDPAGDGTIAPSLFYKEKNGPVDYFTRDGTL